MKILEQGTLPEKRTYEGICDKCKTKFEFKQKEAFYIQQEGDCMIVYCPFCHEKVYVKK